MSRFPGVRSSTVLLPALAACAGGGSFSATEPALANQAPDSLVRAADLVFEMLPDTLSARRYGYYELSPPQIDFSLNPFQGIHWANERYTTSSGPRADRPTFLMYYPIEGRLQLVGMAYAVRRSATDPPLTGRIAADEEWHLHIPCTGMEGQPASLLVFSESQCAQLGGQASDARIAMVHLWTRYPSPAGPFSFDNPTLPFIAVGLVPPSAEEFNGQRGSFLRELGLAIGESIRARPRLGGEIDPNPESDFSEAVDQYRNTIATLVDSLKTAETNSRIARLEVRIVELGRIIRQKYSESAASPQVRMMIEWWYEETLSGGHRHPELVD